MFNERPSLLVDQITKWTAPRKNDRPLSLFDIYRDTMRVQKNSSSKEDLLQCLIIMARLHLVLFRQRIADAAETHRQSRGVDVGKDVYKRWEDLREELALFQDSVRSSSRFIIAQHFFSELEPNSRSDLRNDQGDAIAEAQSPEALSSESKRRLSEIQEDQKDAIAEAQCLESKIRDILQMNTSRLALVESRITIAEGKRVRLRRSHGLL
ncbi:hypothetical protein MMC07_003164 [Pseudocyphellaria aurata]|nr:hypothetical protein [Pseudocyphellaria aurata]